MVARIVARMSDIEAAVERQRGITRTYDRIAGQISWLLGERGVDDAALASAVLGAMRGEPIVAPFTAASRRNVVSRLALLCLWRGPFLQPMFVVSGPLRLERVAAGEGTVAEVVATLRALELEPAADDPQLRQLRALLGEDDQAIADLWSREHLELQARLDALRARLSSDAGRELLDGIVDDVAQRVGGVLVDDGAPPASAAAYIARSRRHVGAAAIDVARTQVAPDKLALALDDAEAAIGLEPENVEALLLRADVLVMSGRDLGRAKDDVARVLALDPAEGHAYAVLGRTLQAEGDHAAALEAFTLAIDAGRPFLPAYVYRGVLRVDDGDLDGADQDAVVATRELPRAAAGYWIRGRVHALRGNGSAALDAYEVALAVDPKHAATYSARADVYTAMGDERRALADLDTAVALSGDGTMYYNRGNVKLAMRDLDGAEADFTAALERNPRDAQAYLNRGTARLMRGKSEGGLDDFRRAAEAAPAYAQARMKYGVLLFELGKPSEALPELRAALAHAPKAWAPRAQVEAIVASIN